MPNMPIDIPDYELLRAAYYGSGGFRDGGYLVRHPREKGATKYRTRQLLSYYLNFTAPVVNSHIDPVFRNEAARTPGGDDRFARFLTDVTGGGEPIQRFMKRAALCSKLYGVALIVLDNDPEQPVSVGGALDRRAYPYAFIVEPSRVAKSKLDGFGKLEMIEYSETLPDPVTGQDKTYYRTWTRAGWTLRPAGWTLKDPLRSGSHDLGVVPVVLLYSRDNAEGAVLPTPEFFAVARANYRIFNLDSEMTEIERNQAFNVLVYPSKQAQTLTVGTENVLGFDGVGSRHAPAFIAPSSDPLNVLRQREADLIKYIYQMAKLSHATGVESNSGISKQWDFEQLNSTLSDFAHNLCHAECQMAELFSKWIGSAVEYECAYKDDFSFRDTEMMLKENILAAVDFGVRPAFRAELEKKMAGNMLGDIPADRMKVVIDEVERMKDMPPPNMKEQMQTDKSGLAPTNTGRDNF